jgi:hypothetical protein
MRQPNLLVLALLETVIVLRVSGAFSFEKSLEKLSLLSDLGAGEESGC